MIKLAPEEYWVKCTFQEIKLYLFTLNIDGKVDWRLPTDVEIEFNPKLGSWWTTEDLLDAHWYSTVKPTYLLIPVRDLKDD